MDKSIVAGLIVMAILIALLCGVQLGKHVMSNQYKDAIIEHGYAEWVKPDGGRGKTVWKWIETEENRHERP